MTARANGNGVPSSLKRAGRLLPGSVKRLSRALLRALRYPTRPVPREDHAFHAFWDFQSQPYALGDIITWHVKACVEAGTRGKSAVDLHVLADPFQPAFRVQKHSVTPFNFMGYLTDLLPAFFLNPMLRNFTFYHDRERFERTFYDHVATGNSVGESATEFVRAYMKGDALNPYHRPIIEFFRDHGDFPRPHAPAATRRLVRSYIASQKEKFVLCIHLRFRESGGDSAQADVSRDARLDGWLAFLAELGDRFPDVLVVALGRPGEWPREFFRLPNVVILKTQGYGLLEEMAMIEEADLFMGTVSGPAEFAYFGVKPYVIIDSAANHAHSAEIRCIPESATSAPFATSQQRLYWGPQTAADLLTLFEESYRAGTATRARGEAAPAREATDPASLPV